MEKIQLDVHYLCRHFLIAMDGLIIAIVIHQNGSIALKNYCACGALSLLVE